MDNKEKSIPENPHAFPFEATDKSIEFHTGMTLRDYFAAKAMQAAITNEALLTTIGKGAKEYGLTNSQAVSKFSYDIADGMLKQREL